MADRFSEIDLQKLLSEAELHEGADLHFVVGDTTFGAYRKERTTREPYIFYVGEESHARGPSSRKQTTRLTWPDSEFKELTQEAFVEAVSQALADSSSIKTRWIVNTRRGFEQDF